MVRIRRASDDARVLRGQPVRSMSATSASATLSAVRRIAKRSINTVGAAPMPLGKARRHQVPRQKTGCHRDDEKAHDEGEEETLGRRGVGGGMAIPIAPLVAQFRAPFAIDGVLRLRARR